MLARSVSCARLALFVLPLSVQPRQHDFAVSVCWCQDGDVQHCGPTQGALAQLCFTRTVPHSQGGAEIPGNCWSVRLHYQKRSQFAGGNTMTNRKGFCILILTVSSSPCLFKIRYAAGIHLSL